ncbi:MULTISPECIES: gamma-glutamyl-gamma-aminobutyrate hydrolase family protein [unclassified Mesorhizobium]|uniref:gamma-glutamyl-gamma-aminobutyrate hydrolase family protein n=1 Tax=unclassified Mesorhizobium TaxID=325217 RepID=UPI000F75E82D|nr:MULTISPECIES: gamma-glutamyl-gamma-aminobutyrate hydrolase family protein [unclassified Mesorhizobium]AZO18044.1 gamma-glutamyl-gamma-aminobutyrate hydrolase family protein [Mesorhizobium sp. M2A.F.Ca.ET.043.05.1.1]RVB72063.1 gamma-glutamyl-gamma-aminobutyrate hydrolase family protein [Mesorhizobium sp. M6A.T.Cr.TU.014.01.1.1]RWP94570.1 MAG: gamma-glutamyl-gamma-aminobutyrate hydrolase family protein [Mesorhizobium sp.]RWP94760.1 MAG: gamma-glutamyl-gamma-aminobutyrate hydrolase family prote
MKPVIGIVSNFDVEGERYFCPVHYVRVIEAAGALPIILPYVKPYEVSALLDHISGLVLTGGGDFPTELYGAAPHSAVQRIIPERDNFEFALIRSALHRPMPILGICRGMQILNVVGGGTIYPHTIDELPDVIDHRDGTPLDQTVHEVHLDRDSRLWRICGEQSSFRVNSYHHQAIKRLAPEFVVSARADDGVVEAIEAPGRPFVIGVQWHPECMYESERACRNLIESFTRACNSIGREAP